MARTGKNIKPIYQIIREDLLREYEKTHCRELPCERDLCLKYQVCRPTVHKALEYFIENQMIVRIPGKGSFFRDDFRAKCAAVRRVVGIVRHDWESWEVDLYFCSVLQGLLATLGSRCQLGFEQFTPELTLRLLAAPDTVSVWISPEKEECAAMQRLAAADQMTVAVNRFPAIPGVFCVGSDWGAIGRCAAAAFLESGVTGFHAVALEAEAMMSNAIRLAMEKALQASGGAVHWLFIPCGDWKESAAKAFGQMLDAGVRAFFLCSKSLLPLLLAALRERGLSLGDDVRLLVSGDDLQFEQAGVSAIRQPMIELGRMAGRMILGDQEPMGGRIGCELIRRASLPVFPQTVHSDIS